jgi:hypothetical protein
VSYSVRGWHINPKDRFTQGGLLLPMTLINFGSLILLIRCFFIGKFRYTKHGVDATDNISLLTARVPDENKVKWGDKVRYLLVAQDQMDSA